MRDERRALHPARALLAADSRSDDLYPCKNRPGASTENGWIWEAPYEAQGQTICITFFFINRH